MLFESSVIQLRLLACAILSVLGIIFSLTSFENFTFVLIFVEAVGPKWALELQ